MKLVVFVSLALALAGCEESRTAIADAGNSMSRAHDTGDSYGRGRVSGYDPATRSRYAPVTDRAPVTPN